MNERSNSVIQTVPAASALHSVPMFDPLKLLRKTTSPKTGEKVLKLDLSYKKMWFLLVHPKGRMLTNILRVTDQMAMFEAQLFADRDDNTVLAQFTSCHTRSESGSQYIRNAQNEALNEALDNAGFGIQLSDLVEHDDSGYGSEVLLSQVEALLREPEQVRPTEQPAPTQPAEPIQTAPVQTAPVQTPPPTQEQAQAPAPQQEKPTQPVQRADDASAVKPVETAGPVTEAGHAQVAEPPQSDTISDAASVVHDHEPKEAPASNPAGEPQQNAPASSASTETASILQMLGGIPASAGGPASEPAAKPKPETRPTVVTFPQAEEPAKTAEAAQQSEPQAAAEPVAEPASYTEDMTVDEIRARMTIEQAKALTVTFGPNKGWTLGQVLDHRPSSLKFYALVSPDASNAIKAGSFLLLDELAQARAG